VLFATNKEKNATLITESSTAAWYYMLIKTRIKRFKQPQEAGWDFYNPNTCDTTKPDGFTNIMDNAQKSVNELLPADCRS